MNEYYFLFALTLVWLVFAVVQDLRTREISNWLNFSLLTIGLSYRGFYALLFDKPSFFFFGLAGAGFFIGLSYLLYYGKAFAGGDAKLLMSLGAVLPFEKIEDFMILGLGFVFLLFLVGALYSLIYTFALVGKNSGNFIKEFTREFRKKLWFAAICWGFAFIFFISVGVFNLPKFYFIGIAFMVLPFLYIYARAFEKACMIRLVSPDNLGEGDWLERDVRVGNKMVKKTVHGLSLEEIAFLRKARKKVWIKEGIPFSPAFILAFGLMVFAFLKWGDLMKVFESFFYLI